MKLFKFELSIGCNDKDTHTQLLSDNDIKNIIIKIASEKIDGFTLVKNEIGYYQGEGEKSYTLIIFETKKAINSIKEIRKDLMIALNQAEIYINKYKYKSVKA